MIGAIIGYIIGRRFDFDNHLSEEFELFAERSVSTDDSALTIAVARWLFGDGTIATMLVDEFDRNPGLSFGAGFNHWVSYGGKESYDSFGNGAAMRVSAIGHFARLSVWLLISYQKRFECLISGDYPYDPYLLNHLSMTPNVCIKNSPGGMGMAI